MCCAGCSWCQRPGQPTESAACFVGHWGQIVVFWALGALQSLCRTWYSTQRCQGVEFPQEVGGETVYHLKSSAESVLLGVKEAVLAGKAAHTSHSKGFEASF